MTKNTLFLLSLCLTFQTSLSVAENAAVPPAANGIELPKHYKNWRLIGVSHREDNNSLRAILGNPVAIAAARSGNTNPWPDGTILAKLVWPDSRHPLWDEATVPRELKHAEFMIKDSVKYARTSGWGFARWLGKGQKPYGSDASFSAECHSCHSKASDYDYVFTRPVPLP